MRQFAGSQSPLEATQVRMLGAQRFATAHARICCARFTTRGVALPLQVRAAHRTCLDPRRRARHELPRHGVMHSAPTKCVEALSVVASITVVAPVASLGLWARLADGQRALPLLDAVEIGDRLTSSFIARQLHKGKALALACVAVRDNAYLTYLAIGGEELGDLLPHDRCKGDCQRKCVYS